MEFWDRIKSWNYSKHEQHNRNRTRIVSGAGYVTEEAWTNTENYAFRAKKLYLECPVSRRCVDIRANKIRSVQVQVEKGNDLTRRLIERPNFVDRTFNQMMSVMDTELDLGGDAWLFLNTTPGQSPTLEVLRQDFVNNDPQNNFIEYNPKGALQGSGEPELVFHTNPEIPSMVEAVYKRGPDGRLREIQGSLLHIQHHNPFSASSGSGSGDAVIRSVDLWLLIDGMLNKRFKSGGRNQGFLSLPNNIEELTDEEFAQLEARLQKISHLNEIQYVADGTEFISSQMTLKDMDLVQIRNQLERAICSAFGVPAVMVNMEGEASYANQRGVDRIFYTGELKPRVDWILGHIQAFLRDNTADKRCVLSIDESQIEYLKTDKMELAKAASSMKIATTNELRAMIGMEPIKGGDELPTAKPAPAESTAPIDPETDVPSDEPRQVSHSADTSRRNGQR